MNLNIERMSSLFSLDNFGFTTQRPILLNSPESVDLSCFPRRVERLLTCRLTSLTSLPKDLLYWTKTTRSAVSSATFVYTMRFTCNMKQSHNKLYLWLICYLMKIEHLSNCGYALTKLTL